MRNDSTESVQCFAIFKRTQIIILQVIPQSMFPHYTHSCWIPALLRCKNVAWRFCGHDDIWS